MDSLQLGVGARAALVGCMWCPGEAPSGLGPAAGSGRLVLGEGDVLSCCGCDELRDKGRDGVVPVLGLGVQLCRRGTDWLCYFGLIQVSVQNLGLMVWLSPCCCDCRLLQG